MERMVLRLALLLPLSCLLACVPARGDPAPMPGQEEALAIVWYQTYGMTDRPPAIEWHDGTCSNGRPGFNDFDGTCLAGNFSDELYLVVQARAHGFAGVAHELLHAALKVSRGDGDGGHRDPGWDAADGRNGVAIPIEKQGALNRARAALRSRNL
jgi:hypothetical protein